MKWSAIRERGDECSPARSPDFFSIRFSVSVFLLLLFRLFMFRALIRLSPAPLSSKSILTRFKHSMRLVQFVEGGRQRVGVETQDGEDVVDISAGEPSIPSDMRSFLEGGEEMMKKAQRYEHCRFNC